MTVPAAAALPTTLIFGTAAAALLSLGGAALIARHAVRLGLQDHPNARSSHQRPTPRGGGVAIVVAFLLALAWCLPAGSFSGWPAWVVLGAGIALALTGLADDRHDLGAGTRLAVQAAAVAALIAAVTAATMPPIESDAGPLVAATGLPSLASWLPAGAPTWLVAAIDLAVLPLALLAGVWWLNLFNFMDGIDGLAAAQALFMLLASLLLKLAGTGVDAGADFGASISAPVDLARLMLAAAVAGFLVLNWPPARIFLGDAGSLFLGFAILAAAVHDVTLGDMSVWTWLILGAAFHVDATVTLLRRWLTGQRVATAHRSHLYQRLARRWRGHQPVSLVYCLLDIAWIFPLALLAHRQAPWAPVILVIACAPLAVVAWLGGAGLKEQ